MRDSKVNTLTVGLGTVALLAGWLSGPACAHSSNALARSKELGFPVIRPGATEVKTSVESGIVFATYRITDPFPGEATRRYLVSEQARLGWKARFTDIIGNSVAGPDDEQCQESGTAGVGTLHWTGYWEDRSGNVTSYSMNYSCVSRDECREARNLEVLAALVPAREAKSYADALRGRYE